MADPSNEHLRSLLAAFDNCLPEIQALSRLASASAKDVGEYGAGQSPLAVVGRLQMAFPRFVQARQTLQAERDRIARRLQEAEGALAALATAPRPLPGSREERAMAASVREAEGESEQTRADLGLADMRLETAIAWDDVRKGFGRDTDVALR